MSFLRAHRTAAAVTVVAALVASVLVVLALTADGYQSRHVDLNDGGVWVTSDSDGLFGRLNKPAGSLDLALNPPGGARTAYQLDVRQDGSAVAAWDRGSGQLLPVDVATGKADADQAVPVSEGEQVGLAGGSVAVLDPAAGKVWAAHVDPGSAITSLRDLDSTTRPTVRFPVRQDVGGTRLGALAVATDGTVYAADSAGDVAVAAASDDGFGPASFSRLDGRLQSVQITVVGVPGRRARCRRGRVAPAR